MNNFDKYYRAMGKRYALSEDRFVQEEDEALKHGAHGISVKGKGMTDMIYKDT